MKVLINNLRLITLSTLVGLTSTLSFADGGHIGGGNALLCYKSVNVRNHVDKEMRARGIEKSTSIDAISVIDFQLNQLSQRPELIDYIDAKKATGLPTDLVEKSTDSALRSINSIYEKLKTDDPLFYKLFESSITKKEQWIPQDGIARVSDANFDYRFPKNCLIAQVAHFNDVTQKINYDKGIVSLFDKANLTALKLHEDFYWFYRKSLYQRISYFKSFDSYTRFYDYWFEKWLKNSTANSDTVRPLVGYVLMNENYNTHEFKNLAKLVAIQIDSEFLRGRFEVYNPGGK